MKTITDTKKINEILTRGVDKIIEKGHLERQLLSGKQLTIYFGIDPTSPVLHLGHSIILRKLAKFQELGHRVILLIGDFTARIGDPTDKQATRQPLSQAQVKANMRDYKKQAGKILDFTKVELKYNSVWLGKLNFEQILEIASHLSVPKLLTRDMFEKRLRKGKTISLHEFLYPLMQGYDSVAMDVDLEIAGADQLFNMLVGRDLQKTYNNKDKDVLTTKLLIGTDGQKMSKSLGNTIALTETPKEIFGKIMSIKDELISNYIELCTDLSIKEQAIKADPRTAKVLLAKEIIKMYHSEKQALEAEKEFNKIFRDKEMPENMPEWQAGKGEYGILDLLFESGLTASKAEAKRMILGRAVEINGQVKTDWQEKIKIENDTVIQVGKRKWLRLKIK